MKALLTGITGFAGSHLTEHLLLQGHEVSGIVLPGDSADNLSHLRDRITLLEGDLLRPETLQAALSNARPDWVFHLAALSSVASSWENPALAFELNVIGGIRLLEACIPFKDQLRVVLVTSAEIYGGGDTSGNLTEESPYSPRNPYAVTKLALDLVAEQMTRASGLQLIRLRPMNHTGPRQAPGFVVPDFAKQIAEIEAGGREPVLKIGNLNSHRDFTDVRDIARAYTLAAERGLSGEAYLICAGKCRPIREALETLLSFSEVSITVEQDPSKTRPVDSHVPSASPSKFAETTGWHPEIPFEQTLRDTLEYWRTKVQSGSFRN